MNTYAVFYVHECPRWWLPVSVRFSLPFSYTLRMHRPFRTSPRAIVTVMHSSGFAASVALSSGVEFLRRGSEHANARGAACRLPLTAWVPSLADRNPSSIDQSRRDSNSPSQICGHSIDYCQIELGFRNSGRKRVKKSRAATNRSTGDPPVCGETLEKQGEPGAVVTGTRRPRKSHLPLQPVNRTPSGSPFKGNPCHLTWSSAPFDHTVAACESSYGA